MTLGAQQHNDLRKYYQDVQQKISELGPNQLGAIAGRNGVRNELSECSKRLENIADRLDEICNRVARPTAPQTSPDETRSDLCLLEMLERLNALANRLDASSLTLGQLL